MGKRNKRSSQKQRFIKTDGNVVLTGTPSDVAAYSPSRGKSMRARSADAKSRGDARRGTRVPLTGEHLPSNVPRTIDSLSSYGAERNALSAGRLLPSFNDSKTKLFMKAFADSDYYTCGAAQLDFITHIAVYIADATGIGLTMDSVSSSARIKDWVATQRTAYLEAIFYGAQLLHQLGIQLIERNLLKLMTQDDTTGYWTQESLDSFLNGIDARKLVIPAASLALVKPLIIAMVVERPWANKDLPSAIFCPFKSQMTLIEAQGYRDELTKRVSQAAIHAAKAELPMVPLSRALFESLPSIIPDDDKNPYIYAWKLLSQIHSTNVAVEKVYNQLGYTTRAASVFNGNMVAAYEDFILVYRGERANDLFAYARMLSIYDAANNTMGMLDLEALANDKIGLYRASQNAVAFTLIPNIAAGISLMLLHNYSPVLNGLVSLTDGTVTGSVGIVSWASDGSEDVWTKDHISYASWTDFEFRLWQMLIKGSNQPNN